MSTTVNTSVYRTAEGRYKWSSMARLNFFLFILFSSLTFYSVMSIYFDWFSKMDDLEIITYFRYNTPFFVSNWIGIILFVYISINCVVHYLERAEISHVQNRETIQRLHKVQELMLFGVTFPTTLIFTIMFWAIFIYDREQIFPKVLDSYPAFVIMNNVLHAVPLPLTLFYVVTFKERESFNIMMTLRGLLIFEFVYVILLITLREIRGHWIYFFMDRLAYSKLMNLISWVILFSIPCHYFGYALSWSTGSIKPRFDKNK